MRNRRERIYMNLNELQKQRQKLRENTDITLNNMKIISDESERVADVAHNSHQLLDNLDSEFESITGLKGNDVKFLFAAIGLQMTRIVVLNELTKIEKAGNKNRNETKLHEFQEKLLGKFNSEGNAMDRLYYASMEHIITATGVPYDATDRLTEESLFKLQKRAYTWNFDLSEMIINKKDVVLFKGGNHRFATLGHDPILGLLFGTGNIMTNTITCVNKPVMINSIPILTTNHVVYTSNFKNPKISVYGSTGEMLWKVFERTKEQPSAFVASLIKQIIHIGTDLYTPCGIQIPCANLILSRKQVDNLTKYISSGDIIKIGTSSMLAELINLLISTLHTLMYDSAMNMSRELYSIKTRKIIMYSNAIATGSNILWLGGNMVAGNGLAFRQLDIGGLIVTIKRLMNDVEYIRKIKEEFVFGGFNRMIEGDKLNLSEPLFDD